MKHKEMDIFDGLVREVCPEDVAFVQRPWLTEKGSCVNTWGRALSKREQHMQRPWVEAHLASGGSSESSFAVLFFTLSGKSPGWLHWPLSPSSRVWGHSVQLLSNTACLGQKGTEEGELPEASPTSQACPSASWWLGSGAPSGFSDLPHGTHSSLRRMAVFPLWV